MIARGGMMVYLVSSLVLIGTVACFFVWARGGLHRFGRWQWMLRALLALPLLVSGVLHFVRTPLMAAIIPPFLPYPSQLVLWSGAFELAGAAGLLIPVLTRSASLCLALLMIAVFPANVYAANQIVAGFPMPGVPFRLVLQVVYIWLLLMAGWGVAKRQKQHAIPE